MNISIFHIILIFKVMLFVFFFHFNFLTDELIFLRPFIEYSFLECKQNVGAGISTLMSISDGFGPSIFCRKMEKARPMREGMDGKVVYFAPESAFFTLMLYFIKNFSLFVPQLGV